jgi:FkbM family methyltransferase
MSLISSLSFIINHPLNKQRKFESVIDFTKWQISSRLVPFPIIYNWINNSKVIIYPGETGLTGNLYCGLHEFLDMAYILHVIYPDNLFVDIGANVGSYTILACQVKGAKGFCFEPVPTTYQRLIDNLRINNLGEQVQSFNIGLSSKEGELYFTSDKNCMNHIVLQGEETNNTIKVKVNSLDTVLENELPSVIKIDVEGFETLVLDGAVKTLSKPSLHSVLMELGGIGSEYGFDEAEIPLTMKSYGFLPYSYDPFNRYIFPLEGKNSTSGNTLFIRDANIVQKKLKSAKSIVINTIKI